MMAVGSQRELPIDLTAEDDDTADESPSKNDQSSSDVIKSWNARKDPLAKPPVTIAPDMPSSNGSGAYQLYGQSAQNEQSRPPILANGSAGWTPDVTMPQYTTSQRNALSASGVKIAPTSPAWGTARSTSNAASPADVINGGSPQLQDARQRSNITRALYQDSSVSTSSTQPAAPNTAPASQTGSTNANPAQPHGELGFIMKCVQPGCKEGRWWESQAAFEAHVESHGRRLSGGGLSEKPSQSFGKLASAELRQGPTSVPGGINVQSANLRRSSGSSASTPTYNTTSASGQGFKRAADGQVRVGNTGSGMRFREHQPAAAPVIQNTVSDRPHPNSTISVPASASQTASTPRMRSSIPAAGRTTGATTSQLVLAVSKQQKGGPYSAEEDQLLLHLKGKLEMSWPDIAQYFPNRTGWPVLQSRYSNKLKERPRKLTWIDSPMSTEPAGSTGGGGGNGSLRRSKRAAEPNRPQPRYVVPPPDAPFDTHEELVPEAHHIQARRQQNSPKRVQDLSDEERQALEQSDSVLAATDDEGRNTASSSILSEATRHTHLHLPTRSSRERLRKEYDRNAFAVSSLTLKLSRAPQVLTESSIGHIQARLLKQTARVKKRASVHISKPYLDHVQRQFVQRTMDDGQWNLSDTLPWDGEMLHVDFTSVEVQSILESVDTIIIPPAKIPSRSQISKIASHAITQGPFINRTQSSVESYLQDLFDGYAAKVPSSTRIRIRRRSHNADRLLRWREEGQSGRRNYADAVHTSMMESFGPTLHFKGTSGDVNTLAWAPNGESFAVGSAALTDPSSMQYNNSHNLLLGDAHSPSLRELPQHAVARSLGTGVNATREMMASQDALLFSTISSIQYFKDSRVLLTGGYDEAVRVWTMGHTPADAHCRFRVPCGAPVEGIATGPSGRFAAAIRSTNDAIKLFQYEDDDSGERCSKLCKLSSPTAREYPEAGITPSCLRWGSGVQSERYLLGGFSSRDDDHRRGETCLWDVVHQQLVVSLNKRSVFDITWSPSIFGRFAVGCSVLDSKSVNRGTKSLVRVYDSRSLGMAHGRPVEMTTNQQATIELECPAWDMNDVIINPRDENLVSAGCTDGSTYIWDLRQPDTILHRLEHSDPLVELGDQRSRESVDLGVRFISWDNYGRRLYTGSSDGVVAAWDPYRATEIAHDHDVVRMDSGIMAGAFSPDYTQLLLGDVQGSVLMLGIDEQDRTIKDCASFDFQHATEAEKRDVALRAGLHASQVPGGPEEEKGVDVARELIRSRQLMLKPLGDLPKLQAVQGPQYRGPMDNTPGAEKLRKLAWDFQCKALLNEPLQKDQQQASRCEVLIEEDVTDNGAWRDRIPHRLGQSVGAKHQESMRCLRCESKDLKAAPWLRYSDSSNDVFRCSDCESTWRADVLGYTLLEAGRPRTPNGSDSLRRESVGSSGRHKGRSRKLKKSRTEEHYAGLWEVNKMAKLGGG